MAVEKAEYLPVVAFEVQEGAAVVALVATVIAEASPLVAFFINYILKSVTLEVLVGLELP